MARYPMFAHARKTPMISWGIVYHRLRTVNLYRTAPKHGRLKLIPRTWQVLNSKDFDKALKFGLCCIGKGYSTLKAEHLDAIKCVSMVKTYSCGSHGIIFGKSIRYETQPFVFNYNHSDGGTGGGCSVVLIVSLLFTAFVSDG